MSRSLAAKTATFVVAKDGSGQYKTVQAAIDAAARSGVSGRKVIFVRRGVYLENIWVNHYTNDLMLVGEGMRLTIVTGSRSVKSGYTTYNSAVAGTCHFSPLS
ncbi:Probable pectinesterase/pectinesterase inhibitor 59 [Ancistrocladus abbreviatus]